MSAVSPFLQIRRHVAKGTPRLLKGLENVQRVAPLFPFVLVILVNYEGSSGQKEFLRLALLLTFHCLLLLEWRTTAGLCGYDQQPCYARRPSTCLLRFLSLPRRCDRGLSAAVLPHQSFYSSIPPLATVCKV